MKEITDALGLPEGAEIPAIVEAINKLKVRDPQVAETPSAKLEKRIRAKMSESKGALNYEQARFAVEGQDAEDKSKAPKESKAKK
jgi:hypothetical protein